MCGLVYIHGYRTIGKVFCMIRNYTYKNKAECLDTYIQELLNG